MISDKVLFLMLNVLMLYTTNIVAAANSDQFKVTSIESRESGYHAVYLSGAIPDEGCTLNDRAIIDESSIGSKALLSNVLTAITHGNFVVIRVMGCTVIDPNQPEHTAPLITKVQLYQNHNPTWDF